jgi:hypothetical protein
MIFVNMLKPNYRTPLQKAADAALATICNRSFSARHPELGKMVNCQVCRSRHRKNERKCVQVFTNRIGDYELLKEDEEGNLVPDYRTCVGEGERPTLKQVMGQAAFAKKRFRPHPSKIKLLFIEKVRVAFAEAEAFFKTNLTAIEDADLQLKIKEFYDSKSDEQLQRARVVAARQLRREHRFVPQGLA